MGRNTPQLWKSNKYSERKLEKISAYTSGMYKTRVSVLDSEIIALMNNLESFKLYLINQKEFTIRTDCESIVKFYHKMNDNKIGSLRWIRLTDYIVGNGFKVILEHIKGKDNYLADQLSRIIEETAAK